MDMTKRFTEEVELLDKLDPASYAAAQNGNYKDISKFNRVVLLIHLGAITATGTFDAKLQQAKDTSGTSVKDITSKAITQLTQAGGGSNKQVAIELKQEELDLAGGFKTVRFVLTPATAASIVGCELYGFVLSHLPAVTTNFAQIVP